MRSVKIKLNPNQEVADRIKQALKDNDNYCPCRLIKNEDTKCMCKEFREQIESGVPGECHCKLYVAMEEDNV